ncbi:hypothetical protein [Tautonia sociabilis]|uniref:Uncharacterized protein n=1 Tax=Tautonia sociabilis TaxID=2080755 RepID=A0A432MIR8_9BACT|nr:hypothetical protein [Tautonia sociabilis]RUL87120.1 hypothetical protein TsocGM_13640 [Tautonia sociabilis]
MVIDRPRPRGPTLSRAAGPLGGPLLLLSLIATTADARQTGDAVASPTLERVDRSLSLSRPGRGEEGDHRRRWLTWRVEYRLVNAGRAPLVVEPGTVFCTVEGWASNSRAEGHGLPRRADHALSAGDGFESVAMLLDGDEPTDCCEERATLQVWPDHEPAPPEPVPGADCSLPEGPMLVPPGDVLRARLSLEHRHHLHGPVEPLLGEREISLRIGPASFRDAVLLERPAGPDGPIDRLGPIPAERLDPRVYFSPPNSLYLDAALAGFRSFQFRDLKVPRDADMRLRFRYFRSLDSTGGARVELKQYQDVPNAYRMLTESKRVDELVRLGSWTLVEHRFRSDPRATTMQLKFILDCEGDGPAALWVDDVSLEPVDRPGEDP